MEMVNKHVILFYIDDLINALSIVLNTTLTDGFIYNVGTGTQTNLKAVFQSFEHGFDYHIPYQFEDPRLGDIKHSCADITPLKALVTNLNMSIKEGITAYLTYNKHNNITI